MSKLTKSREKREQHFYDSRAAQSNCVFCGKELEPDTISLVESYGRLPRGSARLHMPCAIQFAHTALWNTGIAELLAWFDKSRELYNGSLGAIHAQEIATLNATEAAEQRAEEQRQVEA